MVVGAESPPPDGDYFLMMRPEQLHLLSGDAAEGYTVFAGTAKKSVYQGESVLVTVELQDGERLLARHSGDARVADGDTVYLGLKRAQVALVARDAN